MEITKLQCFRHVHWHPDRDELRRFAVAMLVGFAVLGLLAAWRRHSFAGPPLILGGIGVALALGALVPGLGRAVYLGVYVPSSILGYLISHVLMALIFFGLFFPLGLLLRLTGKDLLQMRPPRGRSMWVPRTRAADAASYYRQF